MINDKFELVSFEEWKLKAGAFIIRAMHQLWGKNNEDIMAWIFTFGFNNKFVKDSMFGINLRPAKRPAKAWGLEPVDKEADKLFLNKGIVIPHIVNKELLKVYIYDHETDNDHRLQIIDGSSRDSVILNNNARISLITFNIMDAYFILQEAGDLVNLIIPDLRSTRPGSADLSILESSEKIIVLKDLYLGSRYIEYIDKSITDISYVDLKKSVLDFNKEGGNIREIIKSRI